MSFAQPCVGFYSTDRDIKYKIEKYYCIIKWEIVWDTPRRDAVVLCYLPRNGRKS